MRIRSLTFIVNDIAKSQAFYEKLGFKVLSGDLYKIVMKTDDEEQQLILLKEEKSRKLAGHGMGAFYKENVPGFFQKCKIMGVAFEKDLTDTEDGKTFAFRDPDGNGLEIFEKKENDVAIKEEEPAANNLPEEENISQEKEPENENENDELALKESPRGLGDFQPYVED